MADLEAVDVPPVEVSSQPQSDSDVAIFCSPSGHGLKHLSENNRQEHEKVLKSSSKRRRMSADTIASPTAKENVTSASRKEMDELSKYFNAGLVWKLGSEDEKCCSINSAIACMLEGSNLPLSRLVDEIYVKLKSKETVTLASVRHDVQFISSRLSYGMDSGNTDFFEDESESSLWCWEVRDLKLLPKNKRESVKAMRKGREKVRERIAALSEILSVLEVPGNQEKNVANFLKASERLSKTLSLEEIHLLVQKLVQKGEDEIAKMESKSREREVLKGIETSKRNFKKEMKKHDRELQKEKSQSERELKQHQIEAEKEEKRREKEEAEAKKQLSIQKQASFMERFLKSKKSNNLENQADKPSEHVQQSDFSGKNFDVMGSSIASMDLAFSQQDSMDTKHLWESHVAAWHKMRHSSKYQHWGTRRKPKTKVIDELKLQGSSSEPDGSRIIKTPKKGNACCETKRSDKFDLNIFTDVIEEDSIRNQSCRNDDYIAQNSIQLPRTAAKLLQFDKSHRPAYYGSCCKKSVAVGPCHPFAKDVDLDYDFDSDEEWEEEEPGESLTDCDIDDKEETLEEGPKADDEDGTEDSFIVPDGYLSVDEGVQVDSTRTDSMSDQAPISPRWMPESDNEELVALLAQQKYLDNFTQQALRKNQPLIITNLLHEKSDIPTGKDLNVTSKIEQVCLDMLRMVAYPGGPVVEETVANHSGTDPYLCHTQNENSTTPVAAAATLPDAHLPEYVQCIQSNPSGMANVIESLHKKFPCVSKAQLKSKVREICEFVNSRWQVKKEVLDMIGTSVSPEPSLPDRVRRSKGIATVFSSKLCLPPVGEVVNLATPQTCLKVGSLVSEDSNHAGYQKVLL